jgi:hypothetical protein
VYSADEVFQHPVNTTKVALNRRRPQRFQTRREIGYFRRCAVVRSLCQAQQSIRSVFAKKSGLSRSAGPPVDDNRVDREFIAGPQNVASHSVVSDW